MSESTLSLAKRDLEAKVGTFLGWGRGAEFDEQEWDSQQMYSIKDAVDSGVRQFYYPPPLDQGGNSYDWSFLKPTAEITFVEGESSVRLPDDFGGLEGKITISDPASQAIWPLDIFNEQQVRQKYSLTPDQTGIPQMASLRPVKGTQHNRGQRQDLYIFPLADQDYTLNLTYYLLPDCLTDSFPWVYGGMQHAETVLESCLAIAEQRINDASTVHTLKFMERLAVSISIDRRNKPQTLGLNIDRSDMRYNPAARHWNSPGWTFNGLTPE